MTLTRSKFEQLSADLMARVRGPVTQALNDAGMSKNDINEVVLVGGATRMPMAQETVRTLLGKEPNKSVNPDEVVAVGAAIQAGVLGGEVKDVLLLDVTPLSLGVETMGGVMTKLIERNTTIPVQKSETFSTAADGQPAVEIHMLQGERPMAADNMSLGNFQLQGIAPAPRGTPQIEVTFDIDANGIINVTATDKATGKAQKITVTASTNLKQGEIDKLVREAELHRTEDDQARELAQARNEADTLVYQAEKTLSVLDGKLSETDRQTIEQQIQAVRDASAQSDVNSIRSATEALQNATYALSQQMYNDTSAANGGSASPNEGAPRGEDVVEGDYSEV